MGSWHETVCVSPAFCDGNPTSPSLIARFMGPTSGPSWADRRHVGSMNLAIWGCFPPKVPVRRSLDVIFVIILNKLLNKLSSCQWFWTTQRSCHVIVVLKALILYRHIPKKSNKASIKLLLMALFDVNANPRPFPVCQDGNKMDIFIAQTTNMYVFWTLSPISTDDWSAAKAIRVGLCHKYQYPRVHCIAKKCGANLTRKRNEMLF